MNLKSLKGKFVVLNYSFGPYWNEERWGDDVLTIWKIVRGKLSSVYHPGESDEIDDDYPIMQLKKRNIKKVYTPSIELFFRNEDFLGLKRYDELGEHDEDGGITDWLEYESLCGGDA